MSYTVRSVTASIRPPGVEMQEAQRLGLRSILPWTIACALVSVLWFSFSYGYTEDDAYIHLEFARSLAEGQGFAFGGLVTNGDTAPLWVLALAAIHALGPGWIGSAKLACAAGLIAAVLGVWRLAGDLAADPPSGEPVRPLALGSVLVTVVNPYFAHWSFSGMESVAALAVSVWAVWSIFVGKPTWLRLALGALLLGAGPLLRPELLLLDVVAAPALLWRAWSIARAGSHPVPLGRMIALGVTIALPVVAWCAFAVHTFGSIIPNTNLAKRGGPLLALAPHLALVYLAGFPVALGLLPVAVVRGVARRPVPPAIWALLLWPALCVAFYLADHTIAQTRYCLLSMPSLCIAILWLIDPSGRSALFRGSVGAMVVVSLATIGLAEIPHLENKKSGDRIFSELAAYLREHVPADAPVAAYAIGQIAFESRHPLVDTGGITRPGVIPYLGNPQARLRWAEANGARYFIGAAPPEPGAVQVFAARVPYLGWTLRPSIYRTTEALALYRLP